MSAQGRNGILTLDGVAYRATNVGILSPRNLVLPMDIGSTWQSSYAEGLQSARIVANIRLLKQTTGSSAMAFWNLFVARTFSGGDDDTAAFSLTFATAKKGRAWTDAKAEAFVVTAAPGREIGLQAVFLCPGVAAEADPADMDDYDTQAGTAAPLMFSDASVSGLAQDCYGMEIRYANNHVPDAPLNGTKVVRAWNAGPITAGCSITVREYDKDVPPLADGAMAALALALGGANTRTFTCTSCVPENPRDVGVQAVAPIFQTWQCNVLGTASTKPLVIS